MTREVKIELQIPQKTMDEVRDKIDAALDSVLKASGSALKYHTMQKSLDEMREAMRKVMSDAYVAGSDNCFNAFMAAKK